MNSEPMAFLLGVKPSLAPQFIALQASFPQGWAKLPPAEVATLLAQSQDTEK